MSENKNYDDIENILEQVKKMRSKLDEEPEEPSKSWSMDDIDRLIAESNGEIYVPKAESKPLTPAEDFERILSRDFDDGIFTVKPIEAAAPEMQDISSSSKEAEVDGQEKFFEEDDSADEEPEEFDMDLFELETVIIPEDEAESEPAPAPQKEKEPIDITDYDKDTEQAREIFRKKTEETLDEFDNSHIDSSEYRTRFFKKMTVEDDPEIEFLPDGPVDKSGIIVEKSSEPSESGLEAMPKVLAAENAKALDEQKTRVVGIKSGEAFAEEKTSDDVDGQIMLTGFDDIPAETLPEQTNVNDVEENLSERRRQKAKDFKLINDIDLDTDFEGDYNASPDEVAKEEKARKKAARKLALEKEIEKKAVGVEYTAPEERAEMHTRLTRKASKSVRNLIISSVFEAALLLVNILPSLTEKLSIESEIFAKGSVIFYIINAVLLIVFSAFCSDKLSSGFSDLRSGRITCDTAVSLAVAAALVQNTAAAVFGKGENIAIFTAAAGLGLLLLKASDMLDAERTLGNFEVCAFKYEHNMYAVHSLENEAEIFELGRGLMMGDADMLYSSKLGFPTDLIKNSVIEKGSEKLMKIAVPAAAAAGAAAAVLAGIFTKDIMTALSAFAGTFCICSPVIISFIPSFILSFYDYGLNKAGTMIVSLDEAEKASCANAVILDSADIFSRSRCTMHGMKDFKNIRIDDVLLYASALVIKSGGPLRECFEKVIDGRQDILPPVKELNYEDKLGISAWIHNQKVLLGNRNMLIHHNIDVPEKSVEDRYAHSGRKIIYLAVAEKIAAMFVVSYAVDDTLEPYLRVLEANGIQTLVRTNDVNVTEELMSEHFDLPQENFRVLSSVAGKLFKRRRDAVVDKLPAGIIHDGTAYSMLRALASSCNITAKSKLGSVLQIIISALGFVLTAALFCTGSGEFFTGMTSFLFLLAGLVISSGLVFLGRTK